MDELEAFSDVFEPDEVVTITLNGDEVFMGPFSEAVPVLAEMNLQENDHVVVSNLEVGPVNSIPNFYCPN